MRFSVSARCHLKLKPPTTLQSGAPTLRVLHLSDTHVDPLYEEGSLASCAEYVCCHADDGRPRGPDQTAAGRWGFFERCDIPARTFESMLRHIRDTQKASEARITLLYWVEIV